MAAEARVVAEGGGDEGGTEGGGGDGGAGEGGGGEGGGGEGDGGDGGDGDGGGGDGGGGEGGGACTQHAAHSLSDPHAEVHSYCMRGTGSGRARMRVAGGGSGAQRTAFALGVFYHATTAKWRGPSHVPNRAQSSSPVHGAPYRGHPNFYKDETTGTPHTYMGHHTLILKVGSPLRRRWHTLLGDGQTPSHNCQP